MAADCLFTEDLATEDLTTEDFGTEAFRTDGFLVEGFFEEAFKAGVGETDALAAEGLREDDLCCLAGLDDLTVLTDFFSVVFLGLGDLDALFLGVDFAGEASIFRGELLTEAF